MATVTLLGIPGAGKGTHGRRLADAYGLTHRSTGDVLRANRDYETDTGETVGEIIDGGNLVSNATMRSLLERELDGDDVVLDGYPRNPDQARDLDAVADVDAAVWLDIPVDAAYNRLGERRICGGCGEIYHGTYRPPAEPGVCDIDGDALERRADDTDPDTVRHRVTVQWPRLRRTLAYYDDTDTPLVTVDTDRPVDASWEAVDEAVADYL